MSAIKMDKYIKITNEEPTWTTSVSLKERHKELAKRKNLNLSELLRDVMDMMIEQEKSNEER